MIVKNARLKKEMVSGSPGWWNIIEAAGGWEVFTRIETMIPMRDGVKLQVQSTWFPVIQSAR